MACVYLLDERYWDDPIFDPIRALESDTDDHPLGETREYVARSTLARKDQDLEEYLEKVKDNVRETCWRIVTSARDGLFSSTD